MWLIKKQNSFFKNFLFFLLLPFQVMASGFFLEMEAPETPEQPVSPFYFGGHIGGVYYLKGVEALLEGNVQYRFLEKHAFGLYTSFVFPDTQWDVGLDYRFYMFNSFSNLSEDFLKVGFAFSYFDKLNENYFVPKISLAYGKDLKLISKAPFVLRFSIGGSYLLGEPLAKKINAYSLQESHMVLYVKTGILFF